MKKYILVSALLVLFAACNEAKKAGNLEITGNVQGLKSGVLVIKKIVDTAFVSLDTIKIDGDSHFTANLNITEPEMLYLTLDRGVTSSLDNTLPFFAEPGKMTIDTEVELFFANAKITGSKNNDLYLEYQKIGRKFNDDNLALTQLKFLSAKTKNQKKLDSVQNVQDNIIRRKYLYAVNFVVNNKDFEVAPYVALTEIPNVSLPFMDTIQKALPAKISKSLYGKKLTQLVAQRKILESKQP